MLQVGKEGVITVQDGKTLENELEVGGSCLPCVAVKALDFLVAYWSLAVSAAVR